MQLTGELDLGDAVHFLGNRSDVPEVLAALDVFALTSKIEANPVSILEAMASGKPVVAPRVGSIDESVSDGETGFLTEPGNVRQVADRLAELAGNPQLARRMGQAGRAVVVGHSSLERMVEGYERLIATIYRKKCRAGGPGDDQWSGRSGAGRIVSLNHVGRYGDCGEIPLAGYQAGGGRRRQQALPAVAFPR